MTAASVGTHQRGQSGRVNLARALLFGGWAIGLVSLLNPDEMPFFLLAVVAGAMLVAGGLVLATDGGRAMAALSERYSPWQRVPPHRFMGGLFIAVGALWMVLGVSSALGG
jgi:hypothetical protein